MKKKLPLTVHLSLPPIFLACSYILTLYLHNIGELTLKVLLIPILVTFVVSFSISLVGYIVYKHNVKTSVFLSALTVLFFSYGDTASLIGPRVMSFGKIDFGENHVLGVIYLCVIAAISWAIKRWGKHIGEVYRYIFWLSLVAVCLPVVGIVRYELIEREKSEVHSHFKVPDKMVKENVLTKLPDIYYIVPDSYSSAGNMKKYFGYDDGDFINYLKQKGFYVVDKATSNYPKTYLSISSTLNMEYLDYLSVYTNSTNETLIDPLIKNNSVLSFLKKQGYLYYQLGSWWGPTQYNSLATENFNLDLQNPLGINAFDSLIIKASVIKPFLPVTVLKSVVTESVEDKRRRIIYQFDTLKTIVGLPGPKFIFAHIIAPHGPNVFGKNCEFITQSSLVGLTDEEGYTHQVNCINLKLKETIDVILDGSKQSPIILIQSDEGAPFLAERLTPADNWKDAEEKLLREKFPILSAYYFPGGDYSSLYPTMTSVNSFRVILNHIFYLQIPLLPDRNYINLDMNHRYEFRDVTGKLKDL